MKKSLTISTSAYAIVLCLLLSITSCSRQGELENELAKYYQSEWSRLSDNYTAAHFKARILEYMDTMEHCPYPVATERDPIAQRMAEEYCSSNLYNDLAHIALPHFKKHLTADDLKKINRTINEEKPLATIKKISAISQNELAQLINTHTSYAVADIMNGDTPMAPSLPENIIASYLPAMEKFYVISGRKAIIDNSFTAVKEMMAANAPESRTLAEGFFEFISEATPVMMCIVMEGKVSEDELNMLIEIYERPEFVKLRNAKSEYSQDIINAGNEVFAQFDAWLKHKL